MSMRATFRALCLSLFLCVGVVYADVALPPQTATQQVVMQAPNNSSLHIDVRNGQTKSTIGGMAYDVNAKGQITFKVPPKTQFGNATATTATKTNPVRISDPYGNVTKGSVTTQTQLPSRTTMSKAGGGLMGVAVAGGALQSEGATIGSMIAQGDYTGAGQAAVRGVLNALKGMGNFVTGGAISGVESAVGGYNAEKQRQSMAGAVQAAAEAKAEAAAQAAAAQAAVSAKNYQDYLPNPATGKPAVYPNLAIWWGVDNGVRIIPPGYSFQWAADNGYMNFKEIGLAIGDKSMSDAGCTTCYLSIKTEQLTPENYDRYKHLVDQAIASQIPQAQPADFMLTAYELAQVLQPLINQMLENANANHTELINAIAQLGALPANTPDNTAVVGTAAENTFVSAPYTPAGTNQAQQTQHVVNRDGSITTSYIPRPDLGAHSSIAPTRTKVGTGTSGKTKLDIDIDGGDGSGGEQQSQQKEICNEATADKLLCLDAGSDDYDDLLIPKEDIDVKFDKRNYFNTSGSCPEPVSFSALGHTWQISYEPTCKVARTVRPILELLGMIAAMGIAYGAVREL